MFAANRFDVNGKFLVVAGGSDGLGRDLALQLVRRGAHVTILARSKEKLEETLSKMCACRINPSQRLGAVSVDLVIQEQVEAFIAGLPNPPFALVCVAGGTAEEIGFFADISAGAIRSCMEKNYISSAYIANAVMKRWLRDRTGLSTSGGPRHLVFTASTAALVAVPGYAAYGPTKAAIRALADALRQECLMYRQHVEIRVHCSFPGTIYTDSFYREQLKKPALCKQIEGTAQDRGGLCSEDVATGVLAGLDRGRYFITLDAQTALLLNNMRGPSPRDVSAWDFVLGLVASIVWPCVRMYFDWLTTRFGRLAQCSVDIQDKLANAPIEGDASLPGPSTKTNGLTTVFVD